jgi:hypothetical protein
LVDLIFDVGDGICKEAFGKLTGTHWLSKDAEAKFEKIRFRPRVRSRPKGC